VGGVESEVERLRTRTEVFALRLGGGNYGAYGLLSFLTVRWEHFYFEAARFFGGGGAPSERGDPVAFGGMGVGLGLPWHLGPTGRHELRFGLGIGAGAILRSNHCGEEEAGGITFSERVCVYDQQSFGFILSPEIFYVWHLSWAVALQLGADVQLATHPNKFHDAPEDADRVEFEYPDPVFSGFLGLRF
jgi:hypothetical protein